MNHTKLIVIAGSFTIVIVLVIIVNSLSVKKPEQPISENPTPIISQSARSNSSNNTPPVAHLDTTPIPLRPTINFADKFDPSSQLIVESKNSIRKLPIPYTKEFVASNKITTEIVVPDHQTNDWSLQIYINYINFSSQPGDTDYESHRQAFKETAKELFRWMNSYGVSPSDIYIEWGTRKIERDTAQKWLTN
ncbi:MAG: hypothetical protein WCO06_02395 [Candidatus Roizmanbacteria bacterium]